MRIDTPPFFVPVNDTVFTHRVEQGLLLPKKCQYNTHALMGTTKNEIHIMNARKPMCDHRVKTHCKGAEM